MHDIKHTKSFFYIRNSNFWYRKLISDFTKNPYFALSRIIFWFQKSIFLYQKIPQIYPNVASYPVIYSLIRNVLYSFQFDTWNLANRPHIFESYTLTTKYRQCKNPVTRRVRGVIGFKRKRRCESRAESEGGESNHSHATSDLDLDKEFPDDFDYDGMLIVKAC